MPANLEKRRKKARKTGEKTEEENKKQKKTKRKMKKIYAQTTKFISLSCVALRGHSFILRRCEPARVRRDWNQIKPA